MRVLLVLSSAAVATLLLWLFGTRPLSLVVDRLLPHRVSAAPVHELRFEDGVLAVAGVRLDFLTTGSLPSGLRAELSDSGRVVLRDQAASFPCGSGRGVPSPLSPDSVLFQPDAGDTVTFTQERSRLSWPTPLEMNFMTGYSPSWRRHVYARLLWTKRSGARLEILWRFPQAFYPRDGWRPERLEFGSAGVLRFALQEAPGLWAAAAQYLSNKRQWSEAEYRLEDRGPAADGTGEVFAAIHRDDESAAQPGAGRSVGLVLDYGSRQVVRETAFQ